MTTEEIYIIYPSGHVQIDSLTGHARDNPATLRGLVKGSVEVVPLPYGISMVINSEGKLEDLAANKLATDLALELQSIAPDDYIAGTAILVPTHIL